MDSPSPESEVSLPSSRGDLAKPDSAEAPQSWVFGFSLVRFYCFLGTTNRVQLTHQGWYPV